MATYTVVRGDTLNRIAARNNMSLSELLKLNPDITNPDRISVGQKINLSGDGAAEDQESSSSSTSGSANEDRELIGVPGDPEIWKVSDNDYRLVYYVPNTDPPVPVMYDADKKAMEAIFGPDNDIVADKTMTLAQIKATGALDFGSHDELANVTDDPIDALMDQIDEEVAVRPWLADQGVVEVLTEAMLEGRAPSAAEFEQTEWWQGHNEGQRQWMLVNASDPATAEQRLQSNRSLAAGLLREAGVWEPPEQLVNKIADAFTTGDWDQTAFNNAISYVSDPTSPVKVDADFQAWLKDSGVKVDTTQDREVYVRNEVNKWLGPKFGAWSDAKVQEWAGRIRNDPDGETLLREELQNQRMTLFPEYTNPERTYDDIASTWRQVWTSNWGESADETDPLFVEILRANDIGVAEQRLRQEGLARGNQTVSNRFVSQMANMFSGPQRGF